MAVEEVLQLFGSMRPEYKCIIHIMEPMGLKAALLSITSSKCSTKKSAMKGDSGEPMATLSNCLQNWPLKQKKQEVRTWWNSLMLPSSNC